MRFSYRFAAWAALLLTLATDTGSDPNSCPSVERLKSADPRADATAAMTRGDYHVLMLGGYVGTIPGGEDSKLPALLIEGTEDTTTEACWRLRAYAETYARGFNETMTPR